MKKKTIVGLIAIAAIVAVVIFAGCIETSLYGVEYAWEYNDGYSWESAYLAVNITGPADDIAVIVTNPTGDTTVKTISKEKMIDNFERVKFYTEKNPPAGTYKFVIKTITPEKVVYETEKKFKPAVLRITKAEVELKPVRRWTMHGYYWGNIEKYSVIVENDGDLPLKVDNAIIFIGEKEIKEIVMRWVPPGKREITDTHVYGPLDHEPTTAEIYLYSGEEKVASSEASVRII